MKKLSAVLGLAALLGLATLAFTPDPATVLNWGHDGQTCGISGPYGFGVGQATIVANSGGQTLFRCAGELANPDAAPDKADKGGLTCLSGPTGITFGEVVYTPSGRFSAVCTREP